MDRPIKINGLKCRTVSGTGQGRAEVYIDSDGYAAFVWNKEIVMSKRDEYVARLHARLDQWNAEIDEWVARAETAKEDAKADYQEKIDELRGKREAAGRQLKSLQDAGEDAWEDLKSGVEMAWEAMGEAVESARARFK